NVVGTFAWDDGLDLFTGDPYINLQPVSLSTLSTASVPVGKSTDFYFNVLITRDSNAYDKTRKYHVTVTHTGGSPVVSAQPRQIYVEHLISQNRNGVDSITGPT